MASLRTLERNSTYQPLPLYRDMNSEKSIKLDLNSLCIRRPTDTFFIQVKNPNLIAWGIELDDLLIVEQNATLAINDLIVIEKAGEYKFYQFFNEINGEKILFSLDVREPNLRIQKWQDIELAGVITNVVHQVKSRTAPTRYAA
ncbi:transcriptional regulator [Pasteurellaceae bacterium LFhippo2]|nr:transcriptional regulator [Pasteurellaceae bacterium LFhippo2]